MKVGMENLIDFTLSRFEQIERQTFHAAHFLGCGFARHSSRQQVEKEQFRRQSPRNHLFPPPPQVYRQRHRTSASLSADAIGTCKYLTLQTLDRRFQVIPSRIRHSVAGSFGIVVNFRLNPAVSSLRRISLGLKDDAVMNQGEIFPSGKG